MTSALILAQDPAAPKGPPGEAPFWANPLFMMALLGLFFVVVMLPAQRRQRREQDKMLSSLKPGVKVVTAAGIVGTITKAKDGEDEITVRSEDAKLRVLKSSVTRVLGTEDGEVKA